VNALRLLFGTLTVLPVKPPTSVDRRTAGWAMTLAPLAGLVLGALVAVPLAWAEAYADASPLLLAALAIGALAVLTRAMHLDGLADVADGLGSGRRGEAALAIMKKSDIGPFGVATLVLVLLVQVAALTACVEEATGGAGLLLALVWSRMTVAGVSARFRAARSDGLGQLVAGSVSRAQAFLAVLLTLAVTAGVLAALAAAGRLDARSAAEHPGLVVLFMLATLAGTALAQRCVWRFGGVTGDVYGAAVETTFTAVLVVAALAG